MLAKFEHKMLSITSATQRIGSIHCQQCNISVYALFVHLIAVYLRLSALLMVVRPLMMAGSRAYWGKCALLWSILLSVQQHIQHHNGIAQWRTEDIYILTLVMRVMKCQHNLLTLVG